MYKGYLLAVTGSISVGKTTLCKTLCSHHRTNECTVHHIEVDALRARLLTGNDPRSKKIQKDIIRIFGKEVRSNGGAIDREKLANILFSEGDALQRFDEFFDPILYQTIEGELNVNADLVLIDWALIVEKRQLALTNYNVLLVYTSPKTQRLWLSAQNLSTDQAERRMALQLDSHGKYEAVVSRQRASGTGDLFEVNAERAEEIDRVATIIFDRTQLWRRYVFNTSTT